MGNKTSTNATEQEESGIPKSIQTKIRVMGMLSHGHRMRVEERAELYRAIAELKEDRRRLSADLEQERQEREKTKLNSRSGPGYRDTDKPSWAAYENDQMCSLCNKHASRNTEVPCRVCPRIFHKLCLAKCGECRDADLKAADTALSNAGWSCYICGNLSLLLTEPEINQLIDEFDLLDINKDEHVSYEEFAKGRAAKLNTRVSLLPEDEELQMKLAFKISDQDNDDSLDWWEYLNYEARNLLGKRSKEELVAMLTEKEVIKCKTLFRSMDADHDGELTLLEAKQTVRNWCKRFERGMSQEAFTRLQPDIDLHSEIRAKMFVDAENEQKESITWPEFLCEQALYMICTRPNVIPSNIERVIRDAHSDNDEDF